jgi:hypothetical protein
MLSKSLRDCVQFARFAAEHEIEPRNLAEIVDVANRIGLHSLSDSEPGGRQDKADDNRRRWLEVAADTAGFRVCFSNPYPAFVRKSDGMECRLPYPTAGR